MGIFDKFSGLWGGSNGSATRSLADGLRGFTPRSAAAQAAQRSHVTGQPATPPVVAAEIDGAALMADAIAKAMQAAPALMATPAPAPAAPGKGVAVVDAAIKAAIAQGKTAADFDSVATDLIGAAIRFRDEAPELAAIIDEGQRRSGGKGWLHEIPDLVRERWLAMQPAAAPATAPAR